MDFDLIIIVLTPIAVLMVLACVIYTQIKGSHYHGGK